MLDDPMLLLLLPSGFDPVRTRSRTQLVSQTNELLANVYGYIVLSNVRSPKRWHSIMRTFVYSNHYHAYGMNVIYLTHLPTYIWV